jgi:hypothetical protein
MSKRCPLYTIIAFFLVLGLHSQEIQIFTTKDFDLRGNVKRCLVITPYGRETFEFSPEGLLTKTVTQYNEQDQDITYYLFRDGELVEKRMESYKNNILDEATSMANFYTIDSLPHRRVGEKIISYDKQFLEKQEYNYGEDGRLKNIITSNIDGVDETTFEYSSQRDATTVSTFVNGVLEKSVRTTGNPGQEGSPGSVLTKEYLDGQPNRAHEEVYNEQGLLISSEDFLYHMDEGQFVSQKKRYHHYKDGILDHVVTKTVSTEAVERYIYQFDSNSPANWVKQIVTPSNSYITRVIDYYPKEEDREAEN